jgi:hypothetical protein
MAWLKEGDRLRTRLWDGDGNVVGFEPYIVQKTLRMDKAAVKEARRITGVLYTPAEGAPPIEEDR